MGFLVAGLVLGVCKRDPYRTWGHAPIFKPTKQALLRVFGSQKVPLQVAVGVCALKLQVGCFLKWGVPSVILAILEDCKGVVEYSPKLSARSCAETPRCTMSLLGWVSGLWDDWGSQ